MSEKQRHHHPANPGDTGPGCPGGGGNLEQARQQGAAFLAAADEAIKHALSGDSAKFNEAARQEGGE
ncbi:MAG TPA: hypothetical protein PKX23_03890 [Verrucomicrobiota bacterium]|nr:hypothetical protein [Verrucomicrobiota bacterium]HRT09188.1 hypothetical protein [Candidatus Paceibacterota bacterium]HRT55102.1 hypothetical protein [Candidatus Paceibacterota bacterium]